MAQERLREELIGASSGKFPTEFGAIPPEHRILTPFSGRPAVAMSVKRRFSSKAQPYWVQFKDDTGAVTDTVMKSGDDLRQDQVVLGMLQVPAQTCCLLLASCCLRLAPCALRFPNRQPGL